MKKKRGHAEHFTLMRSLVLLEECQSNISFRKIPNSAPALAGFFVPVCILSKMFATLRAFVCLEEPRKFLVVHGTGEQEALAVGAAVVQEQALLFLGFDALA